jgi:nucleotide-binding universal stress UspA family protein
MDIKDVFALAEPRRESLHAFEAAAALAATHGAHLTGALIWPPVVRCEADMYVVGEAVGALLDTYAAEARALEADYKTRFEDLARRTGVRAEWRHLAGRETEEAVVNARYADVAVAASGAAPSARALAEGLVLASGRPLLLVPPRGLEHLGRRALVAWNASREAARAVSDALPILSRADAVALLVVDPDAHADDVGREPGADIARHLARHGVDVDVRRAACAGRDAGLVILEQAAAFAADLVVMGAYGHSRLTELVLGGATRTVLREATLPVFMAH